MRTAGDHEIRAAVDRTREEVVALRRTIHRSPELAFEEHRTAELVARRSAELGYAVRRNFGLATGVVADLDSGRAGPRLLLRADMDALPITERGAGRVAVSESPGVMHACGHDGHVAMLLGAAAVLADLRDGWDGSVRLCFQPAEEQAGGAMPMIEAGVLDGVSRVLGIHLWAPLRAGMVGVTAGPIFGSADEFRISIRGRGGHGGMPHTSIDPITAAAAVVSGLQSIVSRETSPFAPAVITIGRIEGGTAYNVIADDVSMRGTVRALTSDDRERLLRRVEEMSAAIAAAHRCEVTYERLAGCPPVTNDASTAELVRTAAIDTVGEGNVENSNPVTVGDDMAFMLERVPGCYFLVGAGDAERGTLVPHHHAEFDIDEACLAVGTETMVRAALAVLNATKPVCEGAAMPMIQLPVTLQ
ncbi:MAG TPA: amidohydrolase [Candidatus Saccharimonadales bacterium]|nr:amidohydrolase [Candidatus Saccharimonadales bacterium]